MSEEIEEIERRDRAAGVRYLSVDPRILYRWLKKLFSSLFLVLILVDVAQAGRSFAGGSDKVQIDNPNVPGASQYTVSFWIKCSSFSVDNAIVGYGKGNDTSGTGWAITVGDTGGKLKLTNFSANGASTSTAGMSTGAWHHVAFVRGGTFDNTWYLDGSTNGSPALDAPDAQGATDDFVVGQSVPEASAKGWTALNNCDLAHIAYWSNDLTSGQIASIADKSTCPSDIDSTNLEVFLGNEFQADYSTNAFSTTRTGGSDALDPSGLPCQTTATTTTTTSTTTTTTTTLPTFIEICGNGIDDDSTGGDALCPAPDQDRDGYVTDGVGPYSGIDCDDEDRFIWPGVSTGDGCAAGQYHTCQTSGSYTSCTPLSSFTCHSGSGSTYWIEATETTCTGAGTYADPWALKCFSDTGASGYHAPVAGDCYVLRGGTYTQTWGSSPEKMIYVYDKDGTSTDRITIRGAPGEEAIIESPGVAPDFIIPIKIEVSDYWFVHQLTIREGYAVFGVWFNGSAYGEASNLKIYDLDGDCGSQNCAGVNFDSSGHYGHAHHNYFADNYNRSNPTSQNNTTGVQGFSCDHIKFNDNVCHCTRSGGCGYCIRIKHGTSTGGDEISRNTSQNSYWAAIASAQANINIWNNIIVSSGQSSAGQPGVAIVDLGGAFYPSGVSVRYNTIYASWSLMYNPSTDYGAIADPSITFSDNIVVDERATAYPATAEQGFMSLHHYGSDTLFTDVITGGKVDMNNNCYYNSDGESLFFSVFGASGGAYGSSGGTYTGLAAWEAGTGFDADSFAKDPVLDSDLIATDTDCDAMGWNVGLYSNDPAPPSTGGTSAGSGRILFFKRRDQ